MTRVYIPTTLDKHNGSEPVEKDVSNQRAYMIAVSKTGLGFDALVELLNMC